MTVLWSGNVGPESRAIIERDGLLFMRGVVSRSDEDLLLLPDLAPGSVSHLLFLKMLRGHCTLGQCSHSDVGLAQRDLFRLTLAQLLTIQCDNLYSELDIAPLSTGHRAFSKTLRDCLVVKVAERLCNGRPRAEVFGSNSLPSVFRKVTMVYGAHSSLPSDRAPEVCSDWWSLIMSSQRRFLQCSTCRLSTEVPVDTGVYCYDVSESTSDFLKWGVFLVDSVFLDRTEKFDSDGRLSEADICSDAATPTSNPRTPCTRVRRSSSESQIRKDSGVRSRDLDSTRLNRRLSFDLLGSEDRQPTLLSMRSKHAEVGNALRLPLPSKKPNRRRTSVEDEGRILLLENRRLLNANWKLLGSQVDLPTPEKGARRNDVEAWPAETSTVFGAHPRKELRQGDCEKEALEEEACELRKENSRFLESNEECRMLRERTAKLEAETEQLRQEVTTALRLQREAERLHEDSQQLLEAAQVRVAASEGRCSEVVKQNSKLCEENLRLVEEREASENSAREHESLESSLEALRMESCRESEQVGDVEKALVEEQAQRLAAEEKVASMQQQIARLEEENVRLQIAESKGVALQEENHRLRDKVWRLSEIEKQGEFMEEENKKLQGEIRSLTIRRQKSSQVLSPPAM